jgi:hypothetical protein
MVYEKIAGFWFNKRYDPRNGKEGFKIDFARTIPE